MALKVACATIFCLMAGGLAAGGPGDPWYTSGEQGHFDYYWPGYRDRVEPPAVSAPRDGAGSYRVDGPFSTAPSPWDRSVSGQEGSAPPNWETPSIGARRADLGPGDYRVQDDRSSGDGAPGGYEAPRHGGYSGMRSDWSAGVGYRFRDPLEETRIGGQGGAPRFGSVDYSEPPQSAHPRYRFRGDPVPGGTGWRLESGPSSYRFRPLSEQELDRIETSTGYRPLGGAQGASFYRPESGDGFERASSSAHGVTPVPWSGR